MIIYEEQLAALDDVVRRRFVTSAALFLRDVARAERWQSQDRAAIRSFVDEALLVAATLGLVEHDALLLFLDAASRHTIDRAATVERTLFQPVNPLASLAAARAAIDARLAPAPPARNGELLHAAGHPGVDPASV